MKNKGLFSSLFIDDLKEHAKLDDAGLGRMATLAQTWRTHDSKDTESLWESFLKQALGYLEFVPPSNSDDLGVYPLYEDWDFNKCISILYLCPPGLDINDTSVGRFYPAKLLVHLNERKLNWGILTDGSCWRLYCTKSSRPYEDFVELSLAETLEGSDEAEYGLFERFFHRDSFIVYRPTEAPTNLEESENTENIDRNESATIFKCQLDHDRDKSEEVLEEWVKKPFLAQVDEVLQYICNGFIVDTQKSGEEYTEEERAEIFESAVKLIYRCLFLFYADARRLLPTELEKADLYQRHSIQALCREAHSFRWGKRRDTDQYDLWKHLKGLVNAVNDGDPEYGIMGYNGGLFDDEQERFLGRHKLRNDFLSRALYLLAFVEPFENELNGEYRIPYEDLEVRHLGELYETILEYTVMLADADRIRRRTKKGVEILLAYQTTKKAGDTLIKKGDVYFGASALERKQTGSYYTPESLVRFLNQKTIIQPLQETFECKYRQRFNDLLEHTKNGHDTGTRIGAAQSAAALVQRFAEEEVFHFKVCDPAMGSGHFLVDAANQMADMVVTLLAEIPNIGGMTVPISGVPNDWRRRITRHCIYGVDLNPLAVNLAKLSLWLNCFATHHRLTFLDHHLRCGNSLIGIHSLKQLATIPERKKDLTKKKRAQSLLFDYDDLSGILGEVAEGVASITRIDEDDTSKQKAMLDEALETASRLRPLADLYTTFLMNPDIPVDDYKDIFERLAKDQSATHALNFIPAEMLNSVQAYQERHHFFHWPLEFPDVFGPDTADGFSANIGNPPWDVLQPNTREFYVDYDPYFRGYGKQEAIKIIKRLHQRHPHIARKWNEYEIGFQQASFYFKTPEVYACLQKGKIDLYKAFLERFFTILKKDGTMGIVVPSGIYTDQGCQQLRELFFRYSQVEFLYCFENRWPTVFGAVDGRFKFVTFGTRKGESTDCFKCAFMEHDPERLPEIDSGALRMRVKQVNKFSPDTLSVMEFRSQRDIDVTDKIYSDWPLMADHIDELWNVKLTQEFNMTSHSSLFTTQPKGYPLYEGKMIWQFDSYFSEPTYWLIDNAKVKQIQVSSPSSARVVHRRISASTNERTLVSSIIPCNTVGEVNCTILWIMNEKTPQIRLYLSAVLNSFVLDYILRQKVTTTLNMFYIESLPIPRSFNNKNVLSTIAARSARLICVNESLSDLWLSAFSPDWTDKISWYPLSAPVDKYGPAHEQEIRMRLREDSESLTPQWGPHCGVHDRLPDRRDTGDRAQLRAEIDAYVAHLYGLSRDDFAYILDTFPVLKKKEEKIFGEFISKRKCLEEYERLIPIMEKR